MRAPVVVAKGTDLLAARIREIAAENGVPLVEAPPLARALYRSVELGHEVPAALYVTVAQVLTYVYQLKAAMARGAKPPPAAGHSTESNLMADTNNEFHDRASLMRMGIGVPIGLISILAMMILPLPPVVLDVLFTFNIALSLVIVMAVFNVKRPLDFAIFPTVLLLVTILRARAQRRLDARGAACTATKVRTRPAR